MSQLHMSHTRTRARSDLPRATSQVGDQVWDPLGKLSSGAARRSLLSFEESATFGALKFESAVCHRHQHLSHTESRLVPLVCKNKGAGALLQPASCSWGQSHASLLSVQTFFLFWCCPCRSWRTLAWVIKSLNWNRVRLSGPSWQDGWRRYPSFPLYLPPVCFLSPCPVSLCTTANLFFRGDSWRTGKGPEWPGPGWPAGLWDASWRPSVGTDGGWLGSPCAEVWGRLAWTLGAWNELHILGEVQIHFGPVSLSVKCRPGWTGVCRCDSPEPGLAVHHHFQGVPDFSECEGLCSRSPKSPPWVSSCCFSPSICKEVAYLAQTFRPLGLVMFLGNWPSLVSSEESYRWTIFLKGQAFPKLYPQPSWACRGSPGEWGTLMVPVGSAFDYLVCTVKLGWYFRHLHACL